MDQLKQTHTEGPAVDLEFPPRFLAPLSNVTTFSDFLFYTFTF